MKRALALLPLTLAAAACHRAADRTAGNAAETIVSPAREDTRDATRRAQEEASHPYSIGNVVTNEMAPPTGSARR